ncbi:MAG: DUF998 domain-containing protein [Euryarchaeota archaeon]|nr:DUF998 domain-containing protein [Euryarchaeota archaeon]
MDRKYALFGFLTPLTAFVFIATTVYIHDFQFTGNALSDMGQVGGEKNYIFNMGLILTGIFGFVFALFLYSKVKKYEKGAGLAFMASTLFLICIGLFPEGTDPHYAFSVGFYLLASISIFLFGIIILKRKRKIGVFSIVGIAVGLVTALIPEWKGVAIPETIGAVVICLWVLVISSALWRNEL